MKTWLPVALLAAVAVAPARAAPCHDLRGTWTITLQCAAITATGPIFGPRTLHATIAAQEGCVFTGRLSLDPGAPGDPWVGALHGEQNLLVASDYLGAKATGELSDRRRGSFRGMSFTYTYSEGPNTTACTGAGVRAD